MLGENIKALADLQTSIDLEPDNDLAYYWHGLVNLAMGNYTAASEDLIQSAELDGTSVGGAYTALWLGVISQLTREDENAKQEFMIAREVAEKLEDDDFSRLMSLLELVEGQPDIARDYYQNLLDYQPLPHQLFSPRLYLQLLVILFPENESFLITREWFDIELVKIYDELGVTFPAVLVPGFSPPNENAQSAYVQGNYSLAILYITNDIEDNPSADNYNWRGWINYLDGNLTEAVADHTFSINIDSARAIYYIDRSIAYFELGLLDLAIEDYETAINTNPSYEFILGQEPRDNSTLIGTYTRAIDIYPENTIARTFRGNAHAILGDYENAVMDLEQAILVTPLFVPAYKVLGDVYYQLERYDKALDIYQQYLEIAGDNADEDVLGRLNELKTEN
jgi:tetratricopeptide (TPR) repeat protein